MSGLVELEGNFVAYLARLRSLLDPGNLPVSLPLRNKATESIYGAAFLHFSIDPDLLGKTGDEVGAFSEQLKAVFGWETRSTGPPGDGIIIPIRERGRALSAVVDVLSQFYEKHPNDAVIQKWGFDIGKGVEKAYQIHGHEFPQATTTVGSKRRESTSPSCLRSSTARESDDIPSSCNGAESTKKGRRPVDLMNKAITKGTLNDTGKKYWKCISMDCRYRASGNAQQDRVYKHAAGCEALGRTHPDIRQAIVNLQSGTSSGALLQQGSASTSHSEPPSPRASSAAGVSKSSGAKEQKVEGAVWKWAREGGKAKEREKREKTQQLADHKIMQLTCVCGLVPNILDSPEWKELMHILNPNYNPTSAEKFSNTTIPGEAAFVQKEQLKVLQESENIVASRTTHTDS